MPTLRELEAKFYCYRLGEPAEHWPEGQPWHVPVNTLAEAHGVCFLCPKCFTENQGPIGTHAVICWFVGKVPDSAMPGPGRWNPSGTSLDDLTFIGPGAYSVALTGGGCAWHGFVTNGRG
jgi:hypothetical protein